MKQSEIQIRGSGTSFAILQGTRVLARATSHGNALARLPSIERSLQSKARACLGCSTSFQSRGPHHRLCPTCGKGA